MVMSKFICVGCELDDLMFLHTNSESVNYYWCRTCGTLIELHGSLADCPPIRMLGKVVHEYKPALFKVEKLHISLSKKMLKAK